MSRDMIKNAIWWYILLSNTTLCCYPSALMLAWLYKHNRPETDANDDRIPCLINLIKSLARFFRFINRRLLLPRNPVRKYLYSESVGAGLRLRRLPDSAAWTPPPLTCNSPTSESVRLIHKPHSRRRNFPSVRAVALFQAVFPNFSHTAKQTERSLLWRVKAAPPGLRASRLRLPKGRKQVFRLSCAETLFLLAIIRALSASRRAACRGPLSPRNFQGLIDKRTCRFLEKWHKWLTRRGIQVPL
jgi:hypothetical protein